MRLRQRDLKSYAVRERISIREPGGATYEEWAEEGHTIKANIQPAGGKLMVEMYGERLAYMLTAYVENGTSLKETEGICVYEPEPDYKVVAIHPWNTHMIAHLEKVMP